MSYILDALEKSEKERQQGTVPAVLSVQKVVTSEQKNRSLVLYLIAAALLLNAGLFTWWLAPWQSKKSVAVGQSSVRNYANRVEDTIPKIAMIERKVAHEDDVSTSNDMGRRAQGADKQSHTQSKGTAEKALLAGPTIGHDGPTAALSQSHSRQPNRETNPAEAIIIPPENKIYTLNDLPLAVRQGLPQFTISMHVYSDDPPSRLIRINGRTLREGQELMAGLKIESITLDGVIFVYQKYRFRIALE